MIFFPGCKINIGLNIIEKRADGFHNLESVFYPLKLSDILEVIPDDHFSIQTTGLSIKGDHSDNLVVKAYYLLQDLYDLPPVRIHLHKIVPMGAGLGGGSADGASMLIALKQLFDLDITLTELERFADQLGSDCAFFIRNTPAFVQGKGEIISPVDVNLKGYYIYMVNPGIHVPTREAFGGIVPGAAATDLKKIVGMAPKNWNDKIKNDFENTLFPLHPEIEKIKQVLLDSGAVYASMTGTGSSVYGIFEAKPNPLFPHYFEWIEKL